MQLRMKEKRRGDSLVVGGLKANLEERAEVLIWENQASRKKCLGHQ